MTMLLGLDSTDANAFQGLTFDWLAGYVGGAWPTFSPECQLYPALAKKGWVMSYAVNAEEDADALDCELGDASVAQAAPWVDRQLGRGVWRPMVYANLSRWEDEGLKSDLAHYGDKIRRTVAHYTYVQGVIPAGYDNQQFSDHWQGRNIDANSSLVSFMPAAPVPPSPPVVSPLHYDWFDGGMFPNHQFGKLNERHIVENVYDPARKEPHTEHNQLVLKVARAELRFLADRVKYEATLAHPLPAPSPAFGAPKPSWGVDHRGWRFQQLARRANGQRFV